MYLCILLHEEKILIPTNIQHIDYSREKASLKYFKKSQDFSVFVRRKIFRAILEMGGQTRILIRGSRTFPIKEY